MANDSVGIMTDPSTQEDPAKSTDPNVTNIAITDPSSDQKDLPIQGEGPSGADRGEGHEFEEHGGLTPEERTKLALDQYRRAHAAIDSLHARTAPMWEKYRQMLQEDMNMREAGDQQPPPPPNQEQHQSWLGGLTQLLSVAVPIAMLFGVRGNGYAKGAMMSAMGNFLTSYAKGKETASKQAYQDYKAQVQAIKQSNQERHQAYKDILANKRLALQDQFQMINSISREFVDPTMMRASRTGDMRGVTRHLDNQERAQRSFNRGTKRAESILPKPRKDVAWENYRQYIIDTYGEEYDPNINPSAAASKKTYTAWFQDPKLNPTTATRTREQKEEGEKEAKERKAGPSADDVKSFFEKNG